MEWYYILFWFTFAFFIIKTILSWVFGDTDIDFDTDGDVDFDISSMLSFKGALHFLLGFSSYLAIIAKINSANTYFDPYHFSWIQYVTAVLIGILFTFILYKLYQFMMKLNHFNEEEINVNNYMCTVLLRNGQVDTHTYSYTVLVNTPIGSRKITVLSYSSDINIGSEQKIYLNEQGIYCI